MISLISLALCCLSTTAISKHVLHLKKCYKTLRNIYHLIVFVMYVIYGCRPFPIVQLGTQGINSDCRRFSVAITTRCGGNRIQLHNDEWSMCHDLTLHHTWLRRMKYCSVVPIHDSHAHIHSRYNQAYTYYKALQGKVSSRLAHGSILLPRTELERSWRMTVSLHTSIRSSATHSLPRKWYSDDIFLHGCKESRQLDNLHCIKWPRNCLKINCQHFY